MKSVMRAVLWTMCFCAAIVAQDSRSKMVESILLANPQLASQVSPAQADSILRASGSASNSPAPGQVGDSAESEPDTALPGANGQSVYQDLVQGRFAEPDSLLAELPVFGQDVFRRRSAALAAASALSVPSAYPVGPGDEIAVVLWGRINEQHRLTVDRDGRVSVPRLGPLTVAGMPFATMQSTLVERLKAIEGVEASVTLGQLRSIQVYVMGEVVAPGFYTMSALANVTSALFAAGGPTPMGSLRQVELRRGGGLVRKIDFYDFLLRGVENSSLRLQPGDVVFVPVVRRMVAVVGNVRRGAIYEVQSKTSLAQALDLAGGVSPGGSVNRIQIERLTQNSYRTVLDVQASSVDSIPAFEVEDGDIVKVFPVVNLVERMVFLEGNVKRPGKYELSDGMRLSQVIGGYELLLPETYFIYAVIERYDPPAYLARIIPFNLQRVLDAPGGDPDLPLQSRDRIIVYHRDYFEPDRSVTIDGSVTAPGKFKLLNNMRIRDLILQAGGLREDASMVRGEMYRRRFDSDSVSTEKVEFSVLGAMADEPAHNMVLQRFDRVFIRQKRGWQDERQVMLMGEFVYPGKYVLFEGETLSELIGRAGGFTTDAYVDAAVLTRLSVRELERRRIRDYASELEREIVQTSAMLAAEGASTELQTILAQQNRMLEKLRSIEPTGRVVIDLNDSAANSTFSMESGDVLVVPRSLQTVSVIGEVYNATTFRFEEDQSPAKHYVQLSGGYKPTARKRSTYVILANGSVVSRQMTRVRRYKVAPGDVIVVPQKLAESSAFRRFSNTLDTVLKFSTIAAQTSNTILSIKLATE